MSAIALTRIHTRTRELAPGLIVSLIVAAAASFLSEHYGAPVMLFAIRRKNGRHCSRSLACRRCRRWR